MDNIEVVPLAVTASEKQMLWNKVKLEGGEGIVFKKLDAPYTADRPASGGPQLKCKFWESATCIVTAINTKRSVQIAATEADGIYRDCPICDGAGCDKCTEDADKEYKRQFPDGPRPILSVDFGDPTRVLISR